MLEIKAKVWFYDGSDLSTGTMIGAEEAFAEDFIRAEGNTIKPTDECTILMQYTGLKDKNGVEIYEGDILVVRNLHDNHDIYWNQPTGPAIPTEIKWVDHGWGMPWDTYNFEVIGNIYENPELKETL